MTEYSGNSLTLSINMLKYFPFGKYNQDENGQQKTMTDENGLIYPRISSQCIKSNIRENFGFRHFNIDELCEQIGNNADIIKQRLEQDNSINDNTSYYIDSSDLEEIVNKCGKKYKSDADKKNPSYHLSIKELRKFILSSYSSITSFLDGKSNEQSNKKSNKKSEVESDIHYDFKDYSREIALFGRMFTSCNKASVESACQIADAVACMPVTPEDDFFIKQFSNCERKGSICMGNVQKVGATYHFCCTLNIGELISKQLNGIAFNSKEAIIKTVIELVASFYTLHIKSGESNNCSYCTPDYMNLTIGSTFPINVSQLFRGEKYSNEELIDVVEKQITNDITQRKSIIKRITDAEPTVKSYSMIPSKNNFDEVMDNFEKDLNDMIISYYEKFK